MTLQLQKLDQDLIHEHICERYIELASNTETLKQDLGIFDRTRSAITIDLESPLRTSKKRTKKRLPPTILDDTYNLTVEQSITSLHSNRDNSNSTTGYVLWSTTPFFLKWLLYDPQAVLFREGGIVDDTAICGMLKPSTGILELGGGTAGIMPVVLGNYLGSYICTDQRSLIKKMQSNIRENLLQLSKRRCVSKSLGFEPQCDDDEPAVYLETMPLDWEKFHLSHSTTPTELQPLSKCSTIYIIAMDVIYNEYLIDPFLRTLSLIIKFYQNKKINTHCLVGIHLRAQEVVTKFLEQAILEFNLPFSYIQSDSLDRSRFSLYFM